MHPGTGVGTSRAVGRSTSGIGSVRTPPKSHHTTLAGVIAVEELAGVGSQVQDELT